MKPIIILVLLLLTNIPVSCFGQTVFRDIVKVNPNEIYENRFVIFKDSTCYFKRYYQDNNQYFIYKGHLVKLSDTLYEFTYQPIVEFFCNKRHYLEQDSVHFTIRQVDTIILPISLKVKGENNEPNIVNVQEARTLFAINGIGQNDFLVDTEFFDPLTKEKVSMKISPRSEPELIYYGAQTDNFKLKISIVNNVLSIYPDFKHIWDIRLNSLEKIE